MFSRLLLLRLHGTTVYDLLTSFCPRLQHQLKLLEAQKRQQELILRRKTEEVSSSDPPIYQSLCFHQPMRGCCVR